MQVLSPDLTDGNIYGSRFHNISAIAESKAEPNKLFVGTSDANVWRSLDGGNTWQNITSNLPERYVSGIASSYLTPGLIYVTHTGFKSNDFTPHIHKSTDYGNTWIPIAGNLPPFAINDVAAYPYNDSVLFVATDIGVYATTNGGNTWQRLGTNMPYVINFDIEVDTFTNRLIAGTFGRSMMSYPLDSLTKKTIVSASKLNATNSLQIFPNPVADYVYLKTNNLQKYSIEVFNGEGEIVYAQTFTGDGLSIPTNEWSKGIYILRVRDEQQNSFVKKIIKQ
jgi:hypothetical protein